MTEINEDALFVVDKTPAGESEKISIPAYDSHLKFSVLTEESATEATQKTNKNRANLQLCWNCGSSDHGLRECKQPRNSRTISKNRKDFISTKTNYGFAFQRYHIEKGQKYGHFRPGKISKQLRKALGLSSRQLPVHIYNMRLLGYPPGWLEEAKVSHSGISLFDAGGSQVADPADEEGEVDNEDRDKYDIKKIISYPGYNVPPPKDTVDESEYFNVPPMCQNHSKEAMLDILRPNASQSYKIKKLTSTRAVTSNAVVSSEDDMEYEEIPEVGLLPEDNCGFVPPLPDKEMTPPPPPPPPTDGEDSTSQEGTVENVLSLSLSDLEAKKSQLLAELNDTSIATPKSTLGKIKSVDLGTPILKSVSPYSNLPSSSRFSQNISDVINFENLPDSVGKYEQMSGILRKVRTTLSRTQQ